MLQIETHIGPNFDINFSDCGYYETVEWKKKYACNHSNEFIWCEDCPRVEGITIENEKKGGMDVN